MKVFISWSGEESHAVAQILRTQLPCIINAVKPFVSSEDIDKGAPWFQRIGTELKKSDFGIVCVTGANQASEWVLFEAGALAGRFLKARVAPLLIDIKKASIKPPLSQFQLTELSNREDFFKLIFSINACLGENALPPETLKESFSNWWNSFHQKVRTALTKIPQKETKSVERTEREILDEVLSLTRGIAASDPDEKEDSFTERFVKLWAQDGRPLRYKGERLSVAEALSRFDWQAEKEKAASNGSNAAK